MISLIVVSLYMCLYSIYIILFDVVFLSHFKLETFGCLLAKKHTKYSWLRDSYLHHPCYGQCQEDCFKFLNKILS
jgi:hypothetical protein